jgi:glycogen operon protein
MNDLTSYNGKHNEANGEGNQDGINDNLSWNCGVEGESTDTAVEALRNRQVRNFAAILLLSRGVPMFVAGDEVRRTQKGNNNAYCQDNETSWFDWTLVVKNREMYRFWNHMIEFRKMHAALHRGQFLTGTKNERGLTDIAWHGTKLNNPGWQDPNGRALALTLAGFDGDGDIHIMLNMHWERLDFELPSVPGRIWLKALDTYQSPPLDIAEFGGEPPVIGNVCQVEGRSVVVLLNREKA